MEFEENIKTLKEEFINEEKSSEEKKQFDKYVVRRTQDFTLGLVLGPTSFQEFVLEMISQLLEEKIKDYSHKVHGFWSAFITSVGEDSGIYLEQYGENIGKKVLEMSTSDSVMMTQMSIIEEKNGTNSENANSPQKSKTNTVSISTSATTEVKERKRPLLSIFSRRKNVLEREQSFSRIPRSISEEPSTDYKLETHTTEEPLTDERNNFLLKFFQKIKDKFELENV